MIYAGYVGHTNIWNNVNLSLMGATGFWHREPVSWWRGWGPPLFHLLSLRGGASRACMLYVNELKQKTVTQAKI